MSDYFNDCFKAAVAAFTESLNTLGLQAAEAGEAVKALGQPAQAANDRLLSAVSALDEIDEELSAELHPLSVISSDVLSVEQPTSAITGHFDLLGDGSYVSGIDWAGGGASQSQQSYVSTGAAPVMYAPPTPTYVPQATYVPPQASVPQVNLTPTRAIHLRDEDDVV